MRMKDAPAQAVDEEDPPAYNYGSVSLPASTKEAAGPKLARRFGKLNQAKTRENQVKDAIVSVQPALLRICAQINGLQRQLFAVKNPHDEARMLEEIAQRPVKETRSTQSSQSKFVLSEEDKSRQLYHDQAAYDK